MQLKKLFSEMRGSLRLLIFLSLGGVMIAALAFLSQTKMQNQVAGLQSRIPSTYSAFDRRILHSDPQLDQLLHRLKDSPSVDNLVECQQLLLELAADPNVVEDQLAWAWFVGVISKHAEIHGTDSDIWAWFNTDIINEGNNIMAADSVRRLSICVLREQDLEVPNWMLMNETDVLLAANIVPLKLRFPDKTFAEIDADSVFPTGDGR